MVELAVQSTEAMSGGGVGGGFAGMVVVSLGLRGFGCREGGGGSYGGRSGLGQ
jgi:hypothetical protein